LIDLTGKVVPFSSSYHAEILSIDAGSIAPGMYVLKLRTNQNSPSRYQSIIISRLVYFHHSNILLSKVYGRCVLI
jgi:hypothetical protein